MDTMHLFAGYILIELSKWHYDQFFMYRVTAKHLIKVRL